jgi:hypothetical protein
MLAAFLIGVIYGAYEEHSAWRREAVEHNAAHYTITNSITGQVKWEWNNQSQQGF